MNAKFKSFVEQCRQDCRGDWPGGKIPPGWWKRFLAILAVSILSIMAIQLLSFAFLTKTTGLPLKRPVGDGTWEIDWEQAKQDKAKADIQQFLEFGERMGERDPDLKQKYLIQEGKDLGEVK